MENPVTCFNLALLSSLVLRVILEGIYPCKPLEFGHVYLTVATTILIILIGYAISSFLKN